MNATLFLPFSRAASASAASARGEETAEHSRSCPERSRLRKARAGGSISPPAIASSPSCFHFISPAAMSSFSTISRAMPSSPSCTASSNL